MVKRKGTGEPPVRRVRAFDLPVLGNPRGFQASIPDPDEQNLRDLASEYRQLRYEDMIFRKRRQMKGSSDDSDALKVFTTVADWQNKNRPESADKTITLVKTIYDLVSGQGSRSPDFFDQLSRARELGIITHGDSAEHNKFSVELERLRGDRSLQERKHDLEIQKMHLQREDDRYKFGMAANILGPILGYSAARMSKDFRTMGAEQAKSHNPGNVYTDVLKREGIIPPDTVSPTSLQGETGEMMVFCDPKHEGCGYNKVLVVPVPPPASLSCPGCGKILLTGSAPPGGTEGSQVNTDAETGREWGGRST